MAIQPVEQGSAFAFRNVINNNFYELKVLSGASKPTQSTAAVVGQMYLDTSEGKMYFCSNVSGSVYTWKPFSEFSGSYNDLEDKPSLFSGNYNDLTNKPDSSKISYNNNVSSLEADNVQNAIDEIISLKAAKNGFATLDSSGKIPSTQLPSMNYIPTSQKGIANGVATLDTLAKIPVSQLPRNMEIYTGTQISNSNTNGVLHWTFIKSYNVKCLYGYLDTTQNYVEPSDDTDYYYIKDARLLSDTNLVSGFPFSFCGSATRGVCYGRFYEGVRLYIQKELITIDENVTSTNCFVFTYI